MLPYSLSNFLSLSKYLLCIQMKIERYTGITIFVNSNNARMGPIFSNCPHYWITDGSRYWILFYILWVFQIWIILEEKLFKTLAVSLSLFEILVPSTTFMFSLDIILFDSNDLTAFQNFLLWHMFSTLRL